MAPEYVSPALQREVTLFLRAVADETRLAIIRLLAIGDLRSGEIGERLHLPTNALAYHVKQLRAVGLLRERRSSADARDVYHRLDLDRLSALYAAAGDFLHPGIAPAVAARSVEQSQDQRQTAVETLATRPLRVLFLCTHNSARSQLAEGILRHLGGDRVEAFSAGSMPTEIHPEVIALMREMGLDATGQYSKSLDRFREESFDYVITVCDRVRETCPTFIGHPAQAHWSFPDPIECGDPDQRHELLRTIASELRTRIHYLLLLPHPLMGGRVAPPV